MEETFGFDRALTLIKEGKKVKRLQFRDTCFIKGQFPDEHSMNTLPYMLMEKTSPDGKVDIFPISLSCESIFAEDWVIIRD